MHEVEVKILEVDIASLEEKLLGLGAKKVFEGELYAEFFDDDERSISARRDTLRIRREGDNTILTYKKYREGEAKVREELPVEVDDLDAAKAILDALGYSQFGYERKNRISYTLHEIRFDIDDPQDDLSFIPPFLEIESEDEDTVFEWAERLGYSRDECKAWTMRDLIEHYQ
jgi:predicted adenylyl cyclase CyaB